MVGATPTPGSEGTRTWLRHARVERPPWRPALLTPTGREPASPARATQARGCLCWAGTKDVALVHQGLEPDAHLGPRERRRETCPLNGSEEGAAGSP